MKYLKVILFVIINSFSTICFGQFEINPREGYSTQIGVMVDMLEDIRGRITENVKDLSIEETDFLFDKQANSIGGLMMHIIATEMYYLVETLEERQWNEKEIELYEVASNLGSASREKYKGKPIGYYLDLWSDVRAKSLEGLKQKDDQWFASKVDEGINYHFVWYHVMEHSANHMGQIALVKNRLAEK